MIRVKCITQVNFSIVVLIIKQVNFSIVVLMITISLRIYYIEKKMMMMMMMYASIITLLGEYSRYRLRLVRKNRVV